MAAQAAREDADLVVAFPAELFDGADGIEQWRNGVCIRDQPAYLGAAGGNALTRAAQFVARVAADFLTVFGHDAVHRHSAAQALLMGRAAPCPAAEQAVGRRAVGHFVQLQQGMGSCLRIARNTCAAALAGRSQSRAMRSLSG